MNFWLLKSDPDSYSIDNLKADKKTDWDGIRNYQARNFLRQMTKGDMALVYHSGDEKSVMGVAKISKPAFKDTTSPEEDWSAVEISFVKKFKNPITLKMIKDDKRLSELMLLRQSRLSVTPLTSEEYEIIINLEL
jgi:predicted RNA-binding protein with PUA-like domain